MHKYANIEYKHIIKIGKEYDHIWKLIFKKFRDVLQVLSYYGKSEVFIFV